MLVNINLVARQCVFDFAFVFHDKNIKQRRNSEDDPSDSNGTSTVYTRDNL